MKKAICIPLVIILLSFCACTQTMAQVYEFSLSDNEEENARGLLFDFLEALPEDVKEQFPKGDKTDYNSYDFRYFEAMCKNAMKKALSPALSSFSLLLGCVVIAAAFHIFASTVAGEKLQRVFTLCTSLCFFLGIYATLSRVFSMVDALLSALGDTMLAMLPVMEGIYITTGNLSSATVVATGVSLMIGFTEVLFSKILSPCIYAAFILGAASAISKNLTVSFMSKTFRGILIGAVTAIMTLMTFVLALQSSGAAAADGLFSKTVKFAVGSYIPIVGAGVAESMTLMSQSLSVIKQGCGAVGIAAILIAFLPPLFVLLMSRLSLGATEAASRVLGCEGEGELLCECKGIFTLLIAVCTAAAVMYIIALGIFVSVPEAMG